MTITRFAISLATFALIGFLAGTAAARGDDSTIAKWFNYGDGWPGTNGIPSLTASNDPVIGSPITVDIGNSRGASTLGILFLGASSASVDSGKDGTILVAPSFISLLNVPAGGLSLPGAIPNDSALLGLSAYVQVLQSDPGASKRISFSRGLELRFGECLPPIWGSADNGTSLSVTDPATGASTVIGPSGFIETWAAAFDTDGTLYTIVNGWNLSTKQLATFDLATGAATTVGSPMNVSAEMIALEVSTDGVVYGGDWNGNLYSIDKVTGQASGIGNFGYGYLMDLAFDSSGTLWGVVDNDLLTIDTTTGAGTYVSTIDTMIEDMVMGIMFDRNDTLYATEWGPSGWLHVVDPSTGAATPIVATGLSYPHGGDIDLN